MAVCSMLAGQPGASAPPLPGPGWWLCNTQDDAPPQASHHPELPQPNSGIDTFTVCGYGAVRSWQTWPGTTMS